MNFTASPRRLLRPVATAVASIFACVCLVVLATHDLAGGGTKVDVATGPVPTVAAPQGSTPPSGASGTGSAGVSSGGLQPGGGSPAAGSVLGPTTGAPIVPPGGGGGGGSSPRPTPPPSPTDVAVVSPVLDIFAFGSKVGLPLLCSVAVSAIAANITDPTLSQLAATVAQSCAEGGNTGDEALRALNHDLTALAVLNPALNPAITALVEVFNSAGASDVPFATSLLALANLLRFFVA